MIIGAHCIVYSRNPEADRAFFRDILCMPNADSGDDWPAFRLQPSELAVHSSDRNHVHEIYLMCDDIIEITRLLDNSAVPHSSIEKHSWGKLLRLTLPGGGTIGVYEPAHPRPATGP